MKKKFLSVLITLAMVLAMMPMVTGVVFGAADYLCFTAVGTDSTIQLNKIGSPDSIGLATSTDGENWTNYSVEDTISILEGTKVYFKASDSNNSFSQSDSKYYQFVMTGNIAASGNIMSLVDATCTSVKIPYNYCFYKLFSDCTALTTAPTLPATTLAEGCYNNMFYKCTSLAAAPALPATTLAKRCYYSMFYGCTGLTQAPALPATTLAEGCYDSMFSGCTGLTQAPTLPATTLAKSCYYSMFWRCTGLTQAPTLAATTLAKSCYKSMFYGCTGLTQAPTLPATTLAESCYESMFSGCTGLTQAPTLPATTLAKSCYENMFSGCTGLTQAPTLPATTLAENCYYIMFSGCTGLNDITVKFTKWDNGIYTAAWVNGVDSTGTFHCPSELPIEYSIGSIPTGWTVEELQPEPQTPSTPAYFVYDVAQYNAILAEAQCQQALIDAQQSGTKPAEPTTEPAAEKLTASEAKALVETMVPTVRTENQARGIKVFVKDSDEVAKFKAAGYKVLYDFYRAESKTAPKAEDYKITTVVNKEEPWYLNTAAKKGKKYYYKAVAKVYDANGELVAETELTQGKYGVRTR